MAKKKRIVWVPTPTFLYRNYFYKKFSKILTKDDYFLEVGAGNGEFVKYLLNRGLQGDSIDISKEAVKFMRQRLQGIKGINIRKADIFTYQSPKKYNAIFCFETLEHIEDDVGALKKIHQLLKFNGVFMMSVPAHMSEWDKMDEIKGHYRRYEKKELLRKLKKAGFVTKTFINYGFPFLWILRRITKTGRLITSYSRELGKDAKTRESSIQQEYHPRLKFLVANPLILYPMFKVMDLFIQTDLGFGYIVVADKKKKD